MHLFLADGHWQFTCVDPLTSGSETAAGNDSLTAPMPGRIVSLLAEPGSDVVAGQPLLVMEAMKMEHTVQAPHAGNLTAYRVQAGQSVQEGQLLVALSAPADCAFPLK